MAQFNKGSSSDQQHSGACRCEGFVLGEHVPDGLGELAGDVDAGDLRTPLATETFLVAFVALLVVAVASRMGGGLDECPAQVLRSVLREGTTDVAVISLHGVVYSKAVRMGGDKLDEDIVSHIKSKGRILIGDRTAENIKRQLGSAFKIDDDNRSMDIKGRDLVSGIPKTITIYEDEVREAISETITVIMNAIKVALENTPPELASDIVDRGIVLAGGGALLKGLDELIRHETGLPVIVAEEPLLAVVNGVGKVLDDLDILGRVSL